MFIHVRRVLTVVVTGLVLGLVAQPANVRSPVADVVRQVTDKASVGPLPEAVVVAAALNDLERTEVGVRLRHPRHEVTFTAAGVTLTPRHGGPEWRWTLAAVESGGSVAVPTTAVRPTPVDRVVTYARPGLVEQYVPRARSVEQQFVLPARLALHGGDLTITGRVTSPGAFETTDAGWQWTTAAGSVTLGDVTVFDATGERLPATMAVSAETTRIVVDGGALETATYPVTVDPEVGTNDFRITFGLGLDGDPNFDQRAPAVAYNPTANEYLVVWRGEGHFSPAGVVDGDEEIFGQRVSPEGIPLGARIQISDMGPDGATNFGASRPDVVYNPTADEYFVVWEGVDDTFPLVAGELEIFGQRLTSNGTQIVPNDFRISNMGPDGDTNFQALFAAVAFMPSALEYLVVWTGTATPAPPPLIVDEREVFGQRIDATSGAEIGGDFRISDMGVDGSPLWGVANPAVASNPLTQEFLVVWEGNDIGLVVDEREIYGQRIAFGAEAGPNDFRISDMGPDGDASFDTTHAAVAYNPTTNEFLVVWSGDDNTPPLVLDEREIFGQRLSATGAEVGTNDVRISDMGPDGATNFGADYPAVTYDATANEFLVVWQGSDNTPGEFEIYAQRLTAAGAEVGPNDVRLSDMGPDGDSTFDALLSDVAFNPTTNESLVVWSGDDDTGALVEGELEIFGQRYALDTTCTFTVTPTTVPAPAAGLLNNAIEVTASSNTCQWDATSNSAFITVVDINLALTVPGASPAVLGSATVIYSVAANTGAARTGTMTVAGQTVTVNQAGATGPPAPGCTFTLDTTTVNIPAAGLAVGAVDVTASGSTCGWEAVSNSAFITILDINVALTAPGVALIAPGGSGRVLYSVAANTGAARTGTMTLAGQTVTVTQAGTTGGGGPVITRAYFPDPSANSWVFRTEFSGGVPPYTLFYSRVQNGGFLGSFPMTGPPAWEAFVNCSLQPGATQHGPAIQAGGRWWVVVQDGAGRSSASTVVEGTPSSTHPACQ